MQNAEYGQALQQMGFPQSQLALPQVQCALQTHLTNPNVSTQGRYS